MKANKFITSYCLGILSFGGVVLAQSLTNKPLFETKSIKLVANDEFPEDLECEIFVGPKGIPFFRTEGKQNEVKKLTIDTIGSGPAVSMVRKVGTANSYILSLFTEDSEGKVLMFLDFNFDGVWDVKRTPTREQKNFIFFTNRWVEAEKVDGLLSTKPTAEINGTMHEFRREWRPAK